jgi:hypothetical protein
MAEAGFDPSDLLWMGRPVLGLRLSRSDIFAIPFSMMWGGFAIFWEATVIVGNAPWLFKLWGIPFVALGLYLIAGRFFWDAYVREHTFYALSNSGTAIIQRTGLGAATSMIDLHRIPEVAFSGGGNGIGTIYFGSQPSLWNDGSIPFGRNKALVPQFRQIPNATDVFALCKKMRQ